MCPGRIERNNGTVLTAICGTRVHEDHFGGECVLITESFHQRGGVTLVSKHGERHLEPHSTLALDSGFVVVPDIESPKAFEERRKQSAIDADTVHFPE